MRLRGLEVGTVIMPWAGFLRGLFSKVKRAMDIGGASGHCCEDARLGCHQVSPKPLPCIQTERKRVSERERKREGLSITGGGPIGRGALLAP